MTAIIDVSAVDRPVIVITRDFDGADVDVPRTGVEGYHGPKAGRGVVRRGRLHQPSLRDGSATRWRTVGA